jgi:hypothetical protein
MEITKKKTNGQAGVHIHFAIVCQEERMVETGGALHETHRRSGIAIDGAAARLVGR